MFGNWENHFVSTFLFATILNGACVPNLVFSFSFSCFECSPSNLLSLLPPKVTMLSKVAVHWNKIILFWCHQLLCDSQIHAPTWFLSTVVLLVHKLHHLRDTLAYSSHLWNKDFLPDSDIHFVSILSAWSVTSLPIENNRTNRKQEKIWHTLFTGINCRSNENWLIL